MAGQLTLTIEFARDLKDRDWVFKQDPYCLVYCGRQEFRSRTAWGGGRNPTWNETFRLEVANENMIEIKIKDEEIVHNEFVGEGFIQLANVRACGNDVQDVPLMYKGRPHGFIQVRMAFARSMVMAPPVYVQQQQPVYAAPPPVYVQQQPVYVQPPPVYVQPGYGGSTVVVEEGYGRRGGEVIIEEGYGRRGEVIVEQGYGGGYGGNTVVVEEGYGRRGGEVIVEQGYGGGFGGEVIVEQGYGGGNAVFVDQGGYGGFGGDTVIVEERRW